MCTHMRECPRSAETADGTMTGRPKRRPPAHFSARTKSWWSKVVSEYLLQDHQVALLRLACENLDRAEAAREQIAKNGLVYTDRFGAPKPHPAVGIARDAAVTFSRLVRELNLDADDVPEAPRPPAIANRYQRT